MSRVLFLSLNEGDVLSRCTAEKIGISVIEKLPAGGVRLVCSSRDGAAHMTRKLKKHLIGGEPGRAPYRPTTPLW